jgi:hypothetical protein
MSRPADLARSDRADESLDIGPVEVAKLLRAARARAWIEREPRNSADAAKDPLEQHRSEYAGAALDSAVAVIASSLTSLSVVVAGATRVHHRSWVNHERVLTLAEVRPERWRLMLDAADRLPSILCRLTGAGPRPGEGQQRVRIPWRGPVDLADLAERDRRAALAELGSDTYWMLVSQPAAGQPRTWSVVDGPRGAYWWNQGSRGWEPTTASNIYLTAATLISTGLTHT